MTWLPCWPGHCTKWVWQVGCSGDSRDGGGMGE